MSYLGISKAVDDKVGNKKLNDHGRAANNGQIYIAQEIESGNKVITDPASFFVNGFVLVIGGAYRRHDNADDNTYKQREESYKEGVFQTVDKPLPPCILNEVEMEVILEVAEKRCRNVI